MKTSAKQRVVGFTAVMLSAFALSAADPTALTWKDVYAQITEEKSVRDGTCPSALETPSFFVFEEFLQTPLGMILFLK